MSPLDLQTSWTHRLGVATAWACVPLVLFGGSVTTLGAGMAVDGWLVAEGHFLLVFPVEKWFRDTATFVEHTHRLFGVLVGLLAIATLVMACLERDLVRPRRVRAFALFALILVCTQGLLGGLRVLENSPRLAFVHGALAQAVFAGLCWSALSASPRWSRLREKVAARLDPRVLIATALVFGQVVLGALYRHALRAEPSVSTGAAPGSTGAALETGGANELLMFHLLGAFVATGAVLWLAGAAKRETATGMASLDRAPGRLVVLVLIQVVLGLMAWTSQASASAAGAGGALGPAEWLLSIAHVLTGALLLAQCWITTVGLCALPPGGRSTVLAAHPHLEGAR